MAVFIYVDDIREDDTFWRKIRNEFKGGLENVIIAQNYNQAIDVLDMYKDDEIILDLDHDLDWEGEIPDAKSGLDICKYIVKNNIPLLYFHIHSTNPIGTSNMRRFLASYGYKEIR